MRAIILGLIFLIPFYSFSEQDDSRPDKKTTKVDMTLSNSKVIEKFYTAFANGNSEEMTSCYHKDVVFKDPAFGELKGERAFKMWEMLMSRGKGAEISFDNILTNEDTGSVTWTAKYLYGEKQRKVTNVVNASFKFKDGKIIEHTDDFNSWKWSRQALGASGVLLGWTRLMKNKIQKTTQEQLDRYISENTEE